MAPAPAEARTARRLTATRPALDESGSPTGPPSIESGIGEIARQRPPLGLGQAARRALAEILLDVRIVAPKQPRQPGEAFAPLDAEPLQCDSRIIGHRN